MVLASVSDNIVLLKLLILIETAVSIPKAL